MGLGRLLFGMRSLVCGGQNSAKVYVSPRKNIAAYTHQAGRGENQDGYLVSTRRVKFLAVADGIGGKPGGGVASRIALETLARRSGARFSLEYSFQLANADVIGAANARNMLGMGTTLAAARIKGDEVEIMSCGDSRVFLREKNGALWLMTRDQSDAFDRYRASHPASNPEIDFPLQSPEKFYEYVRGFRGQNLIWNCIGKSALEIFTLRYRLNRGDRLLLCTDGLGYLPYSELAEVLSKDAGPEEIVNELFERTWAAMQPKLAARKDTDNIALVLYQQG